MEIIDKILPILALICFLMVPRMWRLYCNNYKDDDDE
jgi:hypothetical protein